MLEFCADLVIYRPVGHVSAWRTIAGNQRKFDDSSLAPLGIIADQRGAVYVGDYGRNDIQKFDGSGRFLLKRGSSGAGDGHFLAQWGKPGYQAGEFSRPYDVAVDAADNVYVTEYKGQRVQKFDSAGHFLFYWGNSGGPESRLYEPGGLKVSRDGYIYVADYGHDRIQVFRELLP